MNSDFLQPSLLVPIAIGVVVLVAIVVVVLRVVTGKGNNASIDTWTHAAYSLWTGGEDCAGWAEARAQNALRDWYGAKSGGMFQNVVADLRRGTTGDPAWDKVRALDLLRIGLAAKYIDLDQAREQGAAIGRELQATYRSWEDLAQAFERGMHAWQRGRGVNDANQLGRVQKNLPALRSQIWPKIRYETKLQFDL